MEKACNVFTVANGLSTMKVKKAALDTEKRLNIEHNLSSREFGNMLVVHASLRKLWTHSGCSNKAQSPARSSPDAGTNICRKRGPWTNTVKHPDLDHTIINNLTLNYDKMKSWHLPEEYTPAGGVRSPVRCWALVKVWMRSLTEFRAQRALYPKHSTALGSLTGWVEWKFL